MKNKILILIASLAIALPVASRAQNATNFLNSVENYFTSVNTNYSWTDVKLEVSTGYKQVTGANAASELYAQYDIGNFDIGINAQFSGVGSAINAGEAQFGYALISKYDTKLESDVLAGYDNLRASVVIEPRLALKKKLTPNTYAETAVSMPVYARGGFNTSPSFYAGVGFTY